VTPPLVLFVDPTDGPRAQVARSLLSAAIGDRLLVRSAGTRPEGSLKGVADVLAELAIPFVAGHTPLSDFLDGPPTC
jgi:hypothetical protein